MEIDEMNEMDSNGRWIDEIDGDNSEDNPDLIIDTEPFFITVDLIVDEINELRFDFVLGVVFVIVFMIILHN